MYFHSLRSIRGCALFSLWISPHHGRPKTVENKGSNVRYNKINITFPDMVIVENIIPRNMIINLGCASVDNHIPRDDIYDYHHIREGNIYIICEERKSLCSACYFGNYLYASNQRACAAHVILIFIRMRAKKERVQCMLFWYLSICD